MAAQNKIKLYTHPDYTLNLKRWLQHRDLYEGDHDVLVGNENYLWPHPIEKIVEPPSPDGKTVGFSGAMLRSIRMSRTRYTNFSELIISAYLALFFKEDPDTSELEPLFSAEELEDIDGEGTSLVDFVRYQVTLNYLLYGKPIILVDSYAIDAVSKADAKNKGKRPYLEVLNPISVPDWSINKNKYQAIRYEYALDEPRVDMEQQPKRVIVSKALMIQDGKYTVQKYKQVKTPIANGAAIEWEKDGEPIVIEGQWTELPIATISNGQSWTKDVEEKLLQHFNLESVRDNIVNNQGYDRYIAVGAKEDEMLYLAEHTMGRFSDADAKVITLSAGSTASIETALETTENKIFKIAFNKNRIVSSSSKVAESADAQRESRDGLVEVVKSSIGEIETLLNNAFQYVAKFRGINNFTGKIKLSREVTDEDVTQVIATVQGSRDLMAMSPTWKKEAAKKLARSLNLPNQEEIEKEIDGAVVQNQPAGQVAAPNRAQDLINIANGTTTDRTAQTPDNGPR